MRMRTKYGAKKVVRDGMTFDSQIEYKRYCELLLLQRAGAIHDLKRQVEFELIPAQFEQSNGKKRGKCLERAVKYVADFVYRDVDTNKTIVEDTKGFKTPEYKIKRKLMLYVHGIRIKET